MTQNIRHTRPLKLSLRPRAISGKQELWHEGKMIALLAAFVLSLGEDDEFGV